MIDQPERFLHLTATGWTALGTIATAIGSLVAAASIIILSKFNWSSLKLLREQVMGSDRPFVTIHSHYDATAGTVLVFAHNQGAGPALDVVAELRFTPGANSQMSSYAIGSLAKDQDFQFLIGDDSEKLEFASVRYRSVSDHQWLTKVTTLGGHPYKTEIEEVAEGDEEHLNL